MKKGDKSVKNLNIVDVKLIKWSVVAWTLFVIGLLAYWIEAGSIISFIIKWRWLFLILGVVFMIRPVKKYFSKK